MKVLILEDEALAAERLIGLIAQLRPAVKIVASLDSVEEAVAWLGKGPALDLAFFDIQLADGASFEVFERVRVPCPVIFTTAYDQYALRAFKVNSVDYLLKPVRLEELEKAFQQYEALKQAFQPPPAFDPQALAQALQSARKPYKARFVIRSGHQFLSIKVADIAYLFTEHRVNWLRHRNGKKYPLEHSLEQMEEMLDPESFFRISRQCIVHIAAVTEATVYANARLKLRLEDGEETLVSRDRVAAFKEWLGA